MFSIFNKCDFLCDMIFKLPQWHKTLFVEKISTLGVAKVKSFQILHMEALMKAPVCTYCMYCYTNDHYLEEIYVTYHWGKSGAIYCPMFSYAKAVLSPWRETSSLSLKSCSVVSIGLSFPYAPQTMSATLSLTLMVGSLVELKDNWRLEALSILTVLPETTTFTLFWEKVVWVVALPFICEHRLNTLEH